MFTHLGTKSDSGLGQFRAMLQSLITWTHFDDYHFVKLGKLSREEAESAVTHLKQLQEIRDDQIQKQRRERERRDAESRTAKSTLNG